MRLLPTRLGKNTLAVELTNVSPNGFWLLLDGRELFVPFIDFPWFADASIRQLGDVERPSPHHLRWPALDVDLAVESLEHPNRYPLVSQAPHQILRESQTRRATTKTKQGRPRN